MHQHLAIIAGLILTAASSLHAQLVLQAERVATGLDAPVFVTMPPGDLNRLFIVEQNNARILILNRTTGTLNAVPFLSVSGVATGGEQGLLGLAFDPGYATNGFFYVNYTAQPDGRTAIVRYHVSGNPDVADALSATPVLSFSQPQANHNGGWMAFGPDGFLYVATGDGGNGFDQGEGHTEPGGNSQDITNNLLGKMLRIDVDNDDFPGDSNRNYAIPSDNPFVGVTGDDEIWAYGLRNPWRNSFDRSTGDLYIGDVGQGVTEEIDFQPAGSNGGENYGWRLREGTHATPGGVGGPQPAGGINPIYEYDHGGGGFEGSSVTGGYVYRGPIVALQGRYFFGDFSNSRIWSLVFDGSAPASFDGTNYNSLIDVTESIITDAGTISLVSSFGEDPAGNLFIVDYGGEVFEITDAVTAFGSGDHYKLYRVKPNDAAPDFYPFGPVHLSGRFGAADFNVTKRLQLGTPANKNGEGVIDPTTHLFEYKLSSTAGPVETEVQVVNQCDGLRIEVLKAVSLLVPANESLASTPPVPDAMSHDVDHYLCYKARSLTRFPRGTQVEVVDSFDGGASRRYDLRKVNKFCVPVAKSGTPLFLSGPAAGTPKTITPAAIQNADARLLCYQARLARSQIAQVGCGAQTIGDRGTKIEPPQPRHVKVLGVYTNDQFGPEVMDTSKEAELCIPTAELP